MFLILTIQLQHWINTFLDSNSPDQESQGLASHPVKEKKWLLQK